MKKRANNEMRKRGLDRKWNITIYDFAYLYLYIPVFVFLLTWVKSIIALSCVAILVMIFLNQRGKGESETAITKDYFGLLIVGIIFLIWCILSGQGAFVSQSGDWLKHNAILQDLMQKSWPVQYEVQGESGVLSYYIGTYLVPAIAGKFFGVYFAEMAMLLQTWIGLMLVFLCVVQYFRCKGKKQYLKVH